MFIRVLQGCEYTRSDTGLPALLTAICYQNSKTLGHPSQRPLVLTDILGQGKILHVEHIEVILEEVQWAMNTARSSLARWKDQQGYYNNRLNSHFKGKLGEIAVEKFLTNNNLKCDSHFRFFDRENLADIVLKIKGYKKIVRIEVKTWSTNYWEELGRCIAVDQFLDLKKKSDVIVWCLTDIHDIPNNLASTIITLCGWSTINDIQNAPVKLTGLENMRKVKNYQLSETDLRDMNTFLTSISNSKDLH